ncbi:MAG: lysylphosphatidylglycerol synthase domain-containing protein [Thermoleophilia bacterium]
MRRAFAVAFAVALAALAVAGAMTMDLGAAGHALAGADPELLAAAIALYAVGQTISGGMWASCQAAGGVRRLPLGTALGMHWVARAACELLPASLGEAARVALVRRHPAGARAGGLRITGGLVGYKAVDAVVTGVAVLAMALVVPLPGPAAGLRWTAAIAIAAVAAAAVAWRLGAVRPLLSLLPARARAGLGHLGEGAAVLGSRQAAGTAAVLALGAIVARLLSLAALLAALGAPPQAAALAFCVIVLAGIIPGAPGGAGTRELVLIPALAMAYGLPGDEALAFSIAVQGTALIASLAIGSAALAWLAPGLTGRWPQETASPEGEPVQERATA